jgi:hypothetical protein
MNVIAIDQFAALGLSIAFLSGITFEVVFPPVWEHWVRR